MSSFKNYFDVSYFYFFSAVLGLTLLHRHVITLLIGILCIWALRGPKQAIQALSVNYLILLLNNGLWGMPPKMGILRWLVILVVAIRFIPLGFYKALPYSTSISFFYFVVFSLSWLVSPVPLLSVMKLTAFGLFTLTVVTVFACLPENQLDEIQKFLFTLVLTTVFYSIPTVLIPSIGYLTNGTGFQGLLNQPQAFAIFLVPIISYIGTDFLLGKKRQNKLTIVLTILLLGLLYMTECRTGVIAVFLAIATVTLISAAHPRKSVLDWSFRKGAIKVVIGGILVSILIFLSPAVQKNIRSFVFKRSNAETIGEAFNKSRGGGAIYFWQRFSEKPLTGHGFGVDALHGNDKNVTTFMGIPIAAAAEKGFLPAALAEEIGIVGIFALLPFIVALIRGAIKSGVLPLTAMFFGCVFINIGEAVFFSPGYIGGFFWLFIGLGTVKRTTNNE